MDPHSSTIEVINGRPVQGLAASSRTVFREYRQRLLGAADRFRRPATRALGRDQGRSGHSLLLPHPGTRGPDGTGRDLAGKRLGLAPGGELEIA